MVDVYVNDPSEMPASRTTADNTLLAPEWNKMLAALSDTRTGLAVATTQTAQEIGQIRSEVLNGGGGGGSGAADLRVVTPPETITWDGVTDDGPAWTEFLAGLPDGTAVLLPSDDVTSITSQPLLLPQPGGFFSLLPSGRFGPRIRAASNFTGAAIVAGRNWYNNTPGVPGPLFLSSFRVDGNKGATGNGGSDMTRPGVVVWGEKSIVQRLLVENTAGHGIVAQNLSRSGTVNLASQNCLRFLHNEVEFPNGAGIHVFRSSSNVNGTPTANPDGIARDNLIRNPAGRGIDVQGAAGWLVDGNHVWCGTGYMTDGIRLAECWATRITNNYVDKWGNSGVAGTYYGIIISFSDGGEAFMSGNQLRAKEASATAGTTQHGIRIAVGQDVKAVLHMGGNSIQGDPATGPTGTALAWGFSSGASLTAYGASASSVVGRWAAPAADPVGLTRVGSTDPVALSAVPSGTTITVAKVNGVWPTSYSVTGAPSYTGGTASTGVRPTARPDVFVIWAGPDPSPPIVASGTGGMLDGVDRRWVTP